VYGDFRLSAPSVRGDWERRNLAPALHLIEFQRVSTGYLRDGEVLSSKSTRGFAAGGTG
jgi:hypothetical protein